MSASCGQLWNQSMTEHEVSEGNLRQRLRKALPTGDMQRTTWRMLRTRSMEKYAASGQARHGASQVKSSQVNSSHARVIG